MCNGTNWIEVRLVQVAAGYIGREFGQGRGAMNGTTSRLRAGDVIELEIDGESVSAMVLLANSETVIFDMCDGNMPCVARQEDLSNVRVFNGLAA
jgi:hypothetical protein